MSLQAHTRTSVQAELDLRLADGLGFMIALMDGRIFSSAEEVKDTILSLLEDHVNKSVKGGVLRDT